MRLLWVTPYFPRRGVSAARERFWHLLARLARRHEITLVTLVDAEDSDFYGELPPGLAAVEPVARTGFAPDDPLALLPRMVRWVGFAEPALEAAVAARLAAGRYDLVQYEFIEMGVLMPAPRIPTILTVHQLGFAFAGPEWRAEGRGLRRGAVALFRHLRDLDFELRAVLRAHHVITMSPEDAARLQRFLPDLPVSVSPVGVDSTAFRPPARPLPCDSDILFVGHFSHLANRDAVAFLAHEVLPLLGRSVRVRLVGRAVTPEVAALARPEAVEVVGEVPDVRPYLARAAVVVAPVRFGTGMRGKVLEALAMGRPVVTTALGGEGLGATPGHHLLVADSARDFAAALRRLLNDPDHAARLGANGRALVEARFDWDRIAADHDTIYQEVLERARPAPDTLRDRSISMPRRLGRRPALAVGAGLVAWRGLGWYARRATAG